MEKNARNNNKKTTRDKLQLIKVVLIVILAALIMVVVLLPQESDSDTEGTQPTQTTTMPEKVPEMVVLSIEEQGDWMCVSTSYGDFRYPFAFSDLITIEAQSADDHVALCFYANINGSAEPVFTLWLNGQYGIFAGTLTASGVAYALNVEFIEPGEDLAQEVLGGFYAAQETLNDVLDSMVDSGIFVYAD